MRWPRRLAALGLMAGVFFLVGGCFFLRAPVPESPAVVFGPVVGGVGQTVEIPVEILGFPEPGVAGLAVLALRYNPAVLWITEIEGKNGFVILCSCVDNVSGQVKFVAMNPIAGLNTGQVATLRGARLAGGSPCLSLAEQDVQLVNPKNQALPGYAIRLIGAPSYLTRSGR